MLKYTGWTHYSTPDNMKVIYTDENGNDWEELAAEINSMGDVYIIFAYPTYDGSVKSIYNVYRHIETWDLHPSDQDTIYVAVYSELPIGFMNNPQNFMFDENDVIIPNTRFKQGQIDLAVQWANEEIKMLTTPSLLQAYLAEVRAYRAELLAIDLNETPFIDLPFRP